MRVEPNRESIAGWLGINRATLAVLIVVGGLGLSEEIWRNFFGINLKLMTGDVLEAAFYLAVYALALNFIEGACYIAGGAVTHRMGARIALAVSALPMAAGFSLMLLSQEPWAKIVGALLITHWEPLSVPATFEVVGSELPENRRTIAFAVQSIQKRIPKVIGPIIGAWAFAFGYWMNLSLAFGILAVAVLLQIALLPKMKQKEEPSKAPLNEVLREMPRDLKLLLSSEILLRWGDWFVRDFAALYVVGILELPAQDYGYLAALSAFVALATYIPIGKLADSAPSVKPYIGLTFFLFAAFPFCLVLLPKTGMHVTLALAVAFFVNGLREIGEPARKALIASSFPKEVRARAVGLYWGLRSFAFFPAPIVSYLLWKNFGADVTFLAGGTIGMLGTIWFIMRVKCDRSALLLKSNDAGNSGENRQIQNPS